MRGDPEMAREVAVAHRRDSQTMVVDNLLSSESLLRAKVTGVPRRRKALPAAEGLVL